MDTITELERDCVQFLSQRNDDKGGATVTVSAIQQLVELLLTSALRQEDPRSASSLLERAERWCEPLEAMLSGRSASFPLESPVPTSSSSPIPKGGRLSPLGGAFSASQSPDTNFSLLVRLQCVMLKERVYSAVRDTAASQELYPVALRYAKRGHRLSESIAAFLRAVLSRDERTDELKQILGPYLHEGGISDADMLEMERAATKFTSLRSAKNLMNLCVLQSKVKRHHDAAQYAFDSVHILRGILAPSSSSSSLPAEEAGATAGGADDIGDGHPGGLMAAALFNLGSQLELCQRGQEALAAFDEGLDYAEYYLGKKHPLTKQLRRIVHQAADVPAWSSGARGGTPALGGTRGGMERLPAVQSTLAPVHLVAGSAAASSQQHPARRSPVSSHGGGSRLGTGTSEAAQQGGRLAPAPPTSSRTHVRSASLGGGAVNPRRIVSAPSSHDAQGHAGSATARHAPNGYADRLPAIPQGMSAARRDGSESPHLRLSGASALSVPRETWLQVPPGGAIGLLGAPTTAARRSHSSPSKGTYRGEGWVGAAETEPFVDTRKVDAPPAAVLDLSEVLRDQQRELHIPTVARLSAAPSPTLPIALRPLGSGKGPSSHTNQRLAHHQQAQVARSRERPSTRGHAKEEIGDASGTVLTIAGKPPSPSDGSNGRSTEAQAVQTRAQSSRTLGRTVSSMTSGGGRGRGGAAHDTVAHPVALTQQQIDAQREAQLLSWVATATDRQFQEYSRRFRAALTIQTVWRCSRARLERYSRRQVLYYFYYREQRAAANCIAAAFRAWSCRRKYRATVAKRQEQSRQRAEWERRCAAAASKIVKAARRYLVNMRKKKELLRGLRLKQESKLVLYETAAKIVQRWWHIVRVQKAYWRKRSKEIAAENARRREQSRLDDAATEIQRVVRGALGRKYAKAYRQQLAARQKDLQRRLAESTDAVRIFLLELRARWRHRAERPAAVERHRNAAASAIQSSWSEALRRRATKASSQRARLANAAVLCIQRAYRRYCARRTLRVLRTISRVTNRSRIDTEFRQSRAATRIQCTVRQFLARRQFARRKAMFGRKVFVATTVLQRAGRGFAARVQFGVDSALAAALRTDALRHAVETKERLATLIQSFLRAYVSRMLRAVLQDASEREELLIYRRTRRAMQEDDAATRIQSLARMRHAQQVARQQREDLDASVALVSRAVLRLQCFFRKTLAQKILNAKRRAFQQRRNQLALYAEVAQGLFADRVMELESFEGAGRHHIEMAAEASLSALVRAWADPALLQHFLDGDSGGQSDKSTDDDEDDLYDG